MLIVIHVHVHSGLVLAANLHHALFNSLSLHQEPEHTTIKVQSQVSITTITTKIIIIIITILIKSLSLNLDEVKSYLDARCVTAPEAMWRLSEFEMHGKSHTLGSQYVKES